MKWFRRRLTVPADRIEQERVDRVLVSALATVEEILPAARATGSGDLVDQLLDLHLILTEGAMRDVRSHADRG